MARIERRVSALEVENTKRELLNSSYDEDDFPEFEEDRLTANELKELRAMEVDNEPASAAFLAGPCDIVALERLWISPQRSYRALFLVAKGLGVDTRQFAPSPITIESGQTEMQAVVLAIHAITLPDGTRMSPWFVLPGAARPDETWPVDFGTLMALRADWDDARSALLARYDCSECE